MSKLRDFNVPEHNCWSCAFRYRNGEKAPCSICRGADHWHRLQKEEGDYMKIKIKLLDGQMPVKKTEGAACYDCYSVVNVIIKPGETKVIKLGFAIEVPDGYYAEIRGRSGLSSKGIVVATGTVDSDYRGEVGAIVSNIGTEDFKVLLGDRIAQMMIKEVIDTQLEPVDVLSETVRGCGGFGSTGTK